MDRMLDKVRSINAVLLPGPIYIPDEILSYASLKPISHRSSEFVELLAEINKHVRNIMGIGSSDYVVFIPGSSTIGIEAVCYNLLKCGELKTLVVETGFFGYRLVEITSRYTNKLVVKKYDYRKYPRREDILDLLENEDYEAVTIVHNETSIGYVVRFLKDIAKKVREKDAFLIVDGVSSVGAEELKLSEWGIDAVITGSQKALGGLPGLSIVGFSRRYYDKIIDLRDSKGCRPPFYIDLPMYIEEYEKYGWIPTTPPVNSMYVLYASLRRIMDMGVENYIRMHRERAERIYKYTMEKGFPPLIKDPYYRSNTVAVFKVDNAIEIAKAVREKYGILIATGVGELKNEFIRIGLMGFIDEQLVLSTIDKIKELATKI